MLLNIMLPWFPIVLSAAIGARLIGLRKATWLGITCAIFWIIVVQTTTNVPFWNDSITFATLLAGSAAIVGMAHWSASRELDLHTTDSSANGLIAQASVDLDAIRHTIMQFDDWLERHRFSTDPWPDFDEFIRNLLYTHCLATHVRTYRILSEGETMVPMRAMEHPDNETVFSARKGILGHVATTGRSYYAGDVAQGELILALAANTTANESPPAVDWCFPIRQGTRSIGLVCVGRLAEVNARRVWLQTWEKLIAQFWTSLSEVRRSRSASTTDPVSGLMTRDAFLDECERTAAESFQHGEPVALAVISVEGLRQLLDDGRWDAADDLIYQLSAALQQRLRPDDLLGRFDDSRFLLMLRRVDSELATLIAYQLMDRLSKLPAAQSLVSKGLEIRCGVAGSGTQTPPARQLVAHAVRLVQYARQRNERVTSDVAAPPAHTAPPAQAAPPANAAIQNATSVIPANAAIQNASDPLRAANAKRAVFTNHDRTGAAPHDSSGGPPPLEVGEPMISAERRVDRPTIADTASQPPLSDPRPSGSGPAGSDFLSDPRPQAGDPLRAASAKRAAPHDSSESSATTPQPAAKEPTP